jgi:hexosaminidase
VRRPGKSFLFWGDIALRDTAYIRLLPRDLIAVAWEYAAASRFDRMLKPFRDIGMQTWVAPGLSDWNRVWPNFHVALPNIQGFAREGQAGGSTGLLNTSWDDFGDAIFEQTWYGVLFGAAAAWQAGESSIPRFQEAFGLQFHGDTAGHLDAAHRHLMAAHALIAGTRSGDASTYLFYLDPFTEEGVIELARLRPVLSPVRIQAESALVRIARAREQAHLRESSAIDAMELGARRLDWLAAKFQFTDEIARAFLTATDPTRTDVTWVDLAELSGINGRLQDMRDGYVLTRELFERSWRAENRPYWLQNNLARFDLEIGNWVRRIAIMDRARRRFARDRKLPTAAELEIPAALLAPPNGVSVPPASGRRQRD